MLSVWTALITYVFVVCVMLRGLRWARQKLMWRLRNRLIVTYVFIGVIPIVLLISMALVAGYLFAGQFATYIALADLDTELQHLTAANSALAAQFRTLTQSGKLTPELAAEIASSADENFRQRTVTVLEQDKGICRSNRAARSPKSIRSSRTEPRATSAVSSWTMASFICGR